MDPEAPSPNLTPKIDPQARVQTGRMSPKASMLALAMLGALGTQSGRFRSDVPNKSNTPKSGDPSDETPTTDEVLDTIIKQIRPNDPWDGPWNSPHPIRDVTESVRQEELSKQAAQMHPEQTRSGYIRPDGQPVEQGPLRGVSEQQVVFDDTFDSTPVDQAVEARLTKRLEERFAHTMTFYPTHVATPTRVFTRQNQAEQERAVKRARLQALLRPKRLGGHK